MKSLRLRRRKHTKSRKLRTRKLRSRKLRSRKLRTRKLRTRKLRKGGNGPSSSSSQDNFQILLGLLDSYPTYIRDISDLSREVPMDNIKIRQIQNDLNDIENRIVSIFRNNSFDISTLSEEQKDALLYAILRTNGEIAEEYANAYSNVETKEQMPIEIIDQLINDFQDEIENIENDIENGDDYDDDEYDYYVNAFTYLNIIKEIIEQEQPLRIQRMKQKVGDTAMTISTIQPMGTNNRYFLPPNVKIEIEEFIHNPLYYKHFPSNPKQFDTVLSNARENIKTMPSREESSSSSSNALGGRRKSRRRKTIKRKTRRRK